MTQSPHSIRPFMPIPLSPISLKMPALDADDAATDGRPSRTLNRRSTKRGSILSFVGPTTALHSTFSLSQEALLAPGRVSLESAASGGATESPGREGRPSAEESGADKRIRPQGWLQDPDREIPMPWESYRERIRKRMRDSLPGAEGGGPSQSTSWLFDLPGSRTSTVTALSGRTSPARTSSDKESLRRLFLPTKTASSTSSDSKSERSKGEKQAKAKKPNRKRDNSVTAGSDGASPKAFGRNLAQSIANGFLGQHFRRIEADEILTPERIEELRRRREGEVLSQQGQRTSTDSKLSVGTETSESSVEPFHLEKLVAQLNAMPPTEEQHLAVQDAQEVANPPTTLDQQDSPAAEDAAETVEEENHQLEDRETALESMTVGGFTFPMPPKGIPRLRNRAKAEPMPTILESSGASSAPPRPVIDEDAQQRVSKRSKREVFYLNSTPFSPPTLSFIHGPIAVPRQATRRRGNGERVDEAFDKAEFQTAILGTGQSGPGMTGEDEDGEAIEDDIAEWFQEFGFDSHGRLITEEEARQEAPCGSTASSSPPTTVSETEFPTTSHGVTFYDDELDTSSLLGVVGPGRRPREFRSGRLLGRQQKKHKPGAMDAPEAAEDRETAPMRCNLEGGLDDFLRWETAHLCPGYAL